MFWKIYFWIFLIMAFVGHFSSFYIFPAEHRFLVYLGSIFSIISLVAIFGYAFKHSIMKPGFWKAFLFILIMWEISSFLLSSKLYPSEVNPINNPVITLLTFITSFPGYIAIYLYGYRSVELWKNEESEVRS